MPPGPWRHVRMYRNGRWLLDGPEALQPMDLRVLVTITAEAHWTRKNRAWVDPNPQSSLGKRLQDGVILQWAEPTWLVAIQTSWSALLRKTGYTVDHRMTAAVRASVHRLQRTTLRVDAAGADDLERSDRVVTFGTLLRYLWPEAAASERTERYHQKRLHAAIDELRAIGWQITRMDGTEEKYQVRRVDRLHSHSPERPTDHPGKQ